MLELTGLGIISLLGLLYLNNSTKVEINKKWTTLMEKNNLDYKLFKIIKSEYGFKLLVFLGDTGFKKLEKIKDSLETQFSGTIEIQQHKKKSTAEINIITKLLEDNYRFQFVKTKPWELYFGKTYTFKDIKLSLKDLPHVLYSGITSSGKTFCVLTALTNLVHNHSKREVEIYLSQISSKKDLRKFADVEQCRGYSTTLKESYEMFSYIFNLMNKRISMFQAIKPQFIDDIYEWNKAFPQRKMRISYLFMDEFTEFMPDNLDSKTDAQLKRKCLDLLVKIIQQSRAAGIYIITSLQRPDKESLPPRLKAQFNIKIAFKQSNIASSLVVCDSDKAFHIKPNREAIVNANDEYLMKTLYLDNKMIQGAIKDKIDLSHSNYFKRTLENSKKDVSNVGEAPTAIHKVKVKRKENKKIS